MALMDDIVKKTEEGLKTLRETAQDFAFNVEKQAKIGKMRYVDITRLQKSMQGLYTELGQYLYDEVTSGRAVSCTDLFVLERTDRITRIRCEIDALEDEINEIQQTPPPKRDPEKP